MKKIIMLIEDDGRAGPQIKQWIETAIADAQVTWHVDPLEAEKALREYPTGIVRCIVLDMFFDVSFLIDPQALGEGIMQRFPHIATVLMSQHPETKDRVSTTENVPILRLDKPANLFPAGNPEVQLKVEEFRKDLIEAVNCGLLVGSLRAEVEHLRGRQVFRPFLTMRVALAAIPFVASLLVYGASSLYHLPDWVQHLVLTLCAVMGVHLLDRAILFKDFRDAFESVRVQLAELSVAVQHSTQQREDRPMLLGTRERAEDHGKSEGSESTV